MGGSTTENWIVTSFGSSFSRNMIEWSVVQKINEKWHVIQKTSEKWSVIREKTG
jgi:hypothetical protein